MMENTVFDTSNFSNEGAEVLYEVFNKLKAQFNAEADNESGLDFEGFELFGHYSYFKISAAIKITGPNRSFYITFTHVRYFTNNGRYHGIAGDTQNWAIVNLNRDFGHVIIKHPFLLDRLMNLITHTELKLNDKAFDKKFHILASDHAKASMAITPAFIEAFINLANNEMVIEIIGKKMIIGNLKTFNPDDALLLATFADKVAASR